MNLKWWSLMAMFHLIGVLLCAIGLLLVYRGAVTTDWPVVEGATLNGEYDADM